MTARTASSINWFHACMIDSESKSKTSRPSQTNNNCSVLAANPIWRPGSVIISKKTTFRLPSIPIQWISLCATFRQECLVCPELYFSLPRQYCLPLYFSYCWQFSKWKSRMGMEERILTHSTHIIDIFLQVAHSAAPVYSNGGFHGCVGSNQKFTWINANIASTLAINLSNHCISMEK